MIPKIGDKITIHSWIGSEPAQIVKVSKTGKTFYACRNKIEKGANDKLIIVENSFRTIMEEKFTFRKDGTWRCSDPDFYVVATLNEWIYKH